MTSSEWAAWVQAIGSVVAIFAAGGIASWQQRNIEMARQADASRQRRVEDDFARSLAIKVLNPYRELCSTCEYVLRDWKEGHGAMGQLGTMDEGRRPLDEFEVPDLIRQSADELHQLQWAAKDAQQAFFYARDAERFLGRINVELAEGEDPSYLDGLVRPLIVKSLAASQRAVDNLERLIGN